MQYCTGEKNFKVDDVSMHRDEDTLNRIKRVVKAYQCDRGEYLPESNYFAQALCTSVSGRMKQANDARGPYDPQRHKARKDRGDSSLESSKGEGKGKESGGSFSVNRVCAPLTMCY